MNIISFNEETKAVRFVSERIEKELVQRITQNNYASLILTGGTTVRPFLRSLSQLDLDWSKVTVILSDERWVSLDNDRSNEKQLQELFLSQVSRQPNYIRLKTEAATPEAAIPDLEKKIASIPQPVTCSLLSMGADGHVASLFPKGDWGNLLTWYDLQGEKRISLSLSIFQKCLNNIVLVNDQRKATLEGIIKRHDLTQPMLNFSSQVVVFKTGNVH